MMALTELYSEPNSAITKRLVNGASLLEHSRWHGSRPRARKVFAYFHDQYVIWTEYQQADGSQPYTAHGEYLGYNEEMARDVWNKRLKTFRG